MLWLSLEVDEDKAHFAPERTALRTARARAGPEPSALLQGILAALFVMRRAESCADVASSIGFFLRWTVAAAEFYCLDSPTCCILFTLANVGSTQGGVQAYNEYWKEKPTCVFTSSNKSNKRCETSVGIQAV